MDYNWHCTISYVQIPALDPDIYLHVTGTAMSIKTTSFAYLSTKYQAFWQRTKYQ